MIAHLGLLLAARTLVVQESASNAPIAPSGKWVVDQVASRCRATRAYGASGEMTFRIAAQPLTASYRLSVELNRPIKLKYDEPVSVVVEPSGKTVMGRAGGAAAVSDRSTVIETSIDRSPFADNVISAISLSTKGQRIAYLALTSMPALISILKQCESAMLMTFGVDMAAQADVATSPEPVSERTFWNDEYPAEALRAEAEGTVEGRFQVSPAGSVTDCVIVKSSGNAALDQRSCAIWLSRGKFKPALTKDGRPVASAQIFSTQWKLPSR